MDNKDRSREKHPSHPSLSRQRQRHQNTLTRVMSMDFGDDGPPEVPALGSPLLSRRRNATAGTPAHLISNADRRHLTETRSCRIQYGSNNPQQDNDMSLESEFAHTSMVIFNNYWNRLMHGPALTIEQAAAAETASGGTEQTHAPANAEVASGITRSRSAERPADLQFQEQPDPPANASGFIRKPDTPVVRLGLRDDPLVLQSKYVDGSECGWRTRRQARNQRQRWRSQSLDQENVQQGIANNNPYYIELVKQLVKKKKEEEKNKKRQEKEEKKKIQKEMKDKEKKQKEEIKEKLKQEKMLEKGKQQEGKERENEPAERKSLVDKLHLQRDKERRAPRLPSKVIRDYLKEENKFLKKQQEKERKKEMRKRMIQQGIDPKDKSSGRGWICRLCFGCCCCCCCCDSDSSDYSDSSSSSSAPPCYHEGESEQELSDNQAVGGEEEKKDPDESEDGYGNVEDCSDDDENRELSNIASENASLRDKCLKARGKKAQKCGAKKQVRAIIEADPNSIQSPSPMISKAWDRRQAFRGAIAKRRLYKTIETVEITVDSTYKEPEKPRDGLLQYVTPVEKQIRSIDAYPDSIYTYSTAADYTDNYDEVMTIVKTTHIQPDNSEGSISSIQVEPPSPTHVDACTSPMIPTVEEGEEPEETEEPKVRSTWV